MGPVLDSQKDLLRSIHEKSGVDNFPSEKPKERWEIEDYISMSKKKE